MRCDASRSQKQPDFLHVHSTVNNWQAASPRVMLHISCISQDAMDAFAYTSALYAYEHMRAAENLSRSWRTLNKADEAHLCMYVVSCRKAPRSVCANAALFPVSTS